MSPLPFFPNYLTQLITDYCNFNIYEKLVLALLSDIELRLFVSGFRFKRKQSDIITIIIRKAFHGHTVFLHDLHHRLFEIHSLTSIGKVFQANELHRFRFCFGVRSQSGGFTASRLMNALQQALKDALLPLFPCAIVPEEDYYCTRARLLSCMFNKSNHGPLCRILIVK